MSIRSAIASRIAMAAGVVAGSRAATWVASALGANAGYNVNNKSRKILSQGRQPSSKTAMDLGLSELAPLRNYSRQLERNNPTARAAGDAITALVVGSGIALEPDQPEWTADQAERVRKAWSEWCDCATVDGRSIYELQRQGFREVFFAGELVWRFVMLPGRVINDEIPLCLLPLEAEWLDIYQSNVTGSMRNGTMMQVGPITIDLYGRPVEYILRNPESLSLFPAEHVPAREIVHVFEKRRAMQTRGEPWLAPVIETLQQERDLIDSELQAAAISASIGLAITSDRHDALDTTEEGTTDDPAQSLRLGGVARMLPGEKVEAFGHTRPSQQIMPFRSGLRGDTAAALRVPQRFLDRDISRVGSYSAMRGDNQDEERLIGPDREWYGHATIGRCYREILPLICAKVGVPLPRKIKYKLLPDGQPYVNPVEDIAAANDAINSGLSTREAEVGKRGGDWKQVAAQVAKEKTELAMETIKQIKEVQAACEASGVPGLSWPQVLPSATGETAPAPVAPAAESPEAPEPPEVETEVETETPKPAAPPAEPPVRTTPRLIRDANGYLIGIE